MENAVQQAENTVRLIKKLITIFILFKFQNTSIQSAQGSGILLCIFSLFLIKGSPLSLEEILPIFIKLQLDNHYFRWVNWY